MITQNFFNIENTPKIQAESDESNLFSENFASVFAGISNNSQNLNLLSEKSLCPDLSQTPQQNDVVFGVNQDQFDNVPTNQLSNPLNNSEIVPKETLFNPLNTKIILPDSLNNAINYSPVFENKLISVEKTLANFSYPPNQLSNQVTVQSSFVKEPNFLEVAVDNDSLSPINQLDNSPMDNLNILPTINPQKYQPKEKVLNPKTYENQFNKLGNEVMIIDDLPETTNNQDSDNQDLEVSTRFNQLTLQTTPIVTPKNQVAKDNESLNNLSISQAVTIDKQILTNDNPAEIPLPKNQTLKVTNNKENPDLKQTVLNLLISENQFNKSANLMTIPTDLPETTVDKDLEISPKFNQLNLITTPVAIPQNQVSKANEPSKDLSNIQTVTIDKPILTNDISAEVSLPINQSFKFTENKENPHLTELGVKTPINQSDNSKPINLSNNQINDKQIELPNEKDAESATSENQLLDNAPIINVKTDNLKITSEDISQILPSQEKVLNPLASENQFNKLAKGVMITDDLSKSKDGQDKENKDLDVSPKFDELNLIANPILPTQNQVSKPNETSKDLSNIPAVTSDKQILKNDNLAEVILPINQSIKSTDNKENPDLTELSVKTPVIKPFNKNSETVEFAKPAENSTLNSIDSEVANLPNQPLLINNENAAPLEVETKIFTKEVETNSVITNEVETTSVTPLDRFSKVETKTRLKAKGNNLETFSEDVPTIETKIESNTEQTNLSSITENIAKSSPKVVIREGIKPENGLKNSLVSDVKRETAPIEAKQAENSPIATNATRVEIEISPNSTTVTEEKPNFEPKLPKLFREVSEIFAVEDKKVMNSQKPLEVVLAEQIKQKEIIEQIKPNILEIAQLTDKKSEPQILRMRLRPAELGSIEIKLEKNANGTLNAYLKTETESARQALAGNLEQLREALQNSGWQVGKLELSGNSLLSNGNESRENPSRQFEMAENKTSSSNFSQNSTTADSSEDISGNRLVNLRA